MIPPGHFIPDPKLNAQQRVESDMSKLPQALRSRVIIPSADENLRRVMEARGFFAIEAMQQAYLMERQFPDGILYTGPLQFEYGEFDLA